MFRVTADTNIYIAGLIFRGASRRFLELARQGAFDLAVSDAILDEIVDVLQRRFGMPLAEAVENREFIERFTKRVHPTRTVNAIHEDPDDDRILECAAENVSDFIVSYDKDLLRRQRFEGIPIVRVEQFLDRGFGIKAQVSSAKG